MLLVLENTCTVSTKGFHTSNQSDPHAPTEVCEITQTFD